MHRRHVVISLICLLGVILVLRWTPERWQFNKLRSVKGDDPERARLDRIAKKLKDNPEGFKLALEDFSIFGGHTGGYSSWMIEASSLPHVNQALESIERDSSLRLSKRIEAAWMLWQRTDRDEHLLALFDMIRQPGPPAVGAGRYRLVTTCKDEAIASRIRTKWSQPIPMSRTEFKSAVEKGLIGFRLDKTQ